MIAITGATGHLGQIVINKLIGSGLKPTQIIAVVRNAEKAKDLKAKGVELREANYNDLESLVKAFAGVDQLLFVSGSEVGQRIAQHENVIKAAKANQVKLVAYTSILSADTSELGLANEHNQTEKLLKASGLPSVILRNGWYTENYLGGLSHAIQSGKMFGAADQARFSTATREDFAEAAVQVLTTEGHAGKTYELAGDKTFTLSQLAQAVSEVSGKPVTYVNLPEADYAKILVQVGLPDGFAAMLANVETVAQKGWLENNSGTLSKLIQRPTTELKQAIKNALK